VRDWVNWLSKNTATGIQVIMMRCSSAVINQVNMVTNFAGDAIIHSFFAPYFNSETEEERSVLLLTAELLGTHPPRAPQIRCEQTGYMLEFDEFEESYFAFVASMNPQRLQLNPQLQSLVTQFTPELMDRARGASMQQARPQPSTRPVAGPGSFSFDPRPMAPPPAPQPIAQPWAPEPQQRPSFSNVNVAPASAQRWPELPPSPADAYADSATRPVPGDFAERLEEQMGYGRSGPPRSMPPSTGPSAISQAYPPISPSFPHQPPPPQQAMISARGQTMQPTAVPWAQPPAASAVLPIILVLLLLLSIIAILAWLVLA
jgi:hypothetical protein